MDPSAQQMPIVTSHRGYNFQPLIPPASQPAGPAAQSLSPSVQPSYASATAQMMTATGPGLPYGSGASSRSAGRRSPSRGRQRSRDRQSLSRQTSISATPPVGSRSMGPQETMDWNDLIRNITDRLTTLENYNRDTGQRTAEILENINILDAKIETLLLPIAEDIPLYKKYVEDRFLHVTSIAHHKFESHDATLAKHQSPIELAGSSFDTAGDKFRAMDEAMIC